MAGAPFDEPTQAERDALIARYDAWLGQALPQGIRQAIQQAATFHGIGVALTQFFRIQKKAPPGQGGQ